MKSHDLAAETILGYCTSEFDREKKYKLDIKGAYPSDPYLKKYIKAMSALIVENVRDVPQPLAEQRKG